MELIQETDSGYAWGDWLFDDWVELNGVAKYGSRGFLVIFAALPWMMTSEGGMDGGMLAVDRRGRRHLLLLDLAVPVAMAGRPDLSERSPRSINDHLWQAREVARHSDSALRLLRRGVRGGGLSESGFEELAARLTVKHGAAWRAALARRAKSRLDTMPAQDRRAVIELLDIHVVFDGVVVNSEPVSLSISGQVDPRLFDDGGNAEGVLELGPSPDSSGDESSNPAGGNHRSLPVGYSVIPPFRFELEERLAA